MIVTRVRVLVFLLAVFAMFPSTSFPLLAIPGEPTCLTILHTSDMHSHLLPYDCASGTSLGGYARVKGYKDGLARKNQINLLFSSGDVFQGTLFFRFFRGLPDIQFMNDTGYTAMALGNHEFDGGQENMIDAFSQANFPILSANLTFANPRLSRLIKPSTIIPIKTPQGSLRLGLIGLTDENLFDNCPKSLLQGIQVLDAKEAARNEVRHLRTLGVDLIIVLSHLGWNRDVEIAEAIPGINGILGGHTHLFIDPPIVRQTTFGQQFLSQPGEGGRAISRIDLSITPGETAPIVRVAAAGLVPVNSILSNDPNIQEQAQALWNQIEAKVSAIIASTSVMLNGERSQVRSRETNLSNLIADAFLAASPVADLAFINGGSIRSSILGPGVSIADCLNVLPFDNHLQLLEMTGASLRKVFAQVRAEILNKPEFGGFLQVSRGFQVRFEAQGNLLSFNGQPLENEKLYKVITNDFLAQGGNGLSGFTEATASSTQEILDVDAFMRFVKGADGLNPAVEGRIIKSIKSPPYRKPSRQIRVRRLSRPGQSR